MLMFADHMTFCLTLIMSLNYVLDLSVSSCNKNTNLQLHPSQNCFMTDYFAAIMDAGGSDSCWNVLTTQGRFMGEQQQCLNDMDAKINQLAEAFAQASSSRPTPVAPPNLLIPQPDVFRRNFPVQGFPTPVVPVICLPLGCL